MSGIGGINITVFGCGNVYIVAEVNGKPRDFVIKNVLYVPKIGINLNFSIAAATDEMGMNAAFIDNKCHIYQKNQLVLTGELEKYKRRSSDFQRLCWRKDA